MKWRFRIVSIFLMACVMGIGSMAILAGEIDEKSVREVTQYSFQELWQAAGLSSPIIQQKMAEAQNVELDLEILLTNYNVKWNLGGEALLGLPNGGKKAAFQLNGDTQIALTLPFGLQLSAEANLSDLIDKDRDYLYFFRAQYPLIPGVWADPLLLEIRGKRRELAQVQSELQGEKEKVYIQLWGKFHTALILQDSLELAEEEVLSSQEKLARWRKLYAQNNITENDMLLQEFNVAKSQAALEKISQEHLICLYDLLNLAGLELTGEVVDLPTEIALIGEFKPDAPEISVLPPIDEMVNGALAKNSAVRKAELALQNMQEVVRSKQTSGGIKLGTEFILTNSPLASNEWSVGLSASIELFDGKRKALEEEKDHLQLIELERALSNAKLAVVLEVNTLRSKYHLALLDYQSANLEYLQAKLEYAYKLEQQKQGMLNNEDTRAFQHLVRGKELNYLQKLVNLQVSCWELSQLTNADYLLGGV